MKGRFCPATGRLLRKAWECTSSLKSWIPNPLIFASSRCFLNKATFSIPTFTSGTAVSAFTVFLFSAILYTPFLWSRQNSNNNSVISLYTFSFSFSFKGRFQSFAIWALKRNNLISFSKFRYNCLLTGTTLPFTASTRLISSFSLIMNDLSDF